MYTKEDLLARLQNGEDLAAIADEMATALNEAQREYEEETKRLEEQKVEEDRIWAAKKEAAYMMLDALSDYLIAAGEDELQKELNDVEVETIIKMLDSSIDMTKRLKKLESLEFADEALWTPLFKGFGFGC